MDDSQLACLLTNFATELSLEKGKFAPGAGDHADIAEQIKSLYGAGLHSGFLEGLARDLRQAASMLETEAWAVIQRILEQVCEWLRRYFRG